MMRKNIISLIMIVFVFTTILSIAGTVKAASSDTTLKSLSIEPAGTGFLQDEENNKIYRVKVDNNVTSVTVKAETNNQNATVSVSGNNNLTVGTNKVTVKVTAEDGTSTNYIIYVRRADTPISGETIIPNVQDDDSQEAGTSDDTKDTSKEENTETQNTVKNEEVSNEIIDEPIDENVDNTDSENLVNEEASSILTNNNIENSENTIDINGKGEMTTETIISIIVVIIVILIIALMSRKKRRK